MFRAVQNLAMVVFVAGCAPKSGDDSGTARETGMSSPDAAACGARAETGQQMTPGDTPNSTAPAIQSLNTPYTIQLAANRGGWVRLVLPSAGRYTIHTGFAGVLYGLYTDAGEYPMGEERQSIDCPETIPAVYPVDATGPTTLYMQLGPLTSMNFWVYVQQEP